MSLSLRSSGGRIFMLLIKGLVFLSLVSEAPVCLENFKDLEPEEIAFKDESQCQSKLDTIKAGLTAQKKCCSTLVSYENSGGCLRTQDGWKIVKSGSCRPSPVEKALRYGFFNRP